MPDASKGPGQFNRRDLLRLSVITGAGLTVGAPLLSACSVDSGSGSGSKQSAGSGATQKAIGNGITEKKKLAPFQFGAPAGEKPSIPKRIAWANTSDAEFFLQITRSIELAATARGLEFVTAIANDDSAKNVEQIETFLQRGIGALCIQPLDANAQAPLMKRAIEAGAAVMSLVTPPSTSQAVADQYKVGNTQGLAAAKYITEKLGGKANAVYFNIDTIEVLKARHQGVLDGLKTAGPGVKIIADVQPPALTQDGGFKAMNTILQAHPDVNVILGGDTFCLGALSALQAAGKDRPEMYLSGIDGDEQALAEVRKSGAYKASFAFAYPLMGYAWGQFAADWLEGKPIPQVMQFNAIELNSAETIDKYRADMKAVAETWQNAGTYFTLLGSIRYQERDQFINYAA
ncbi:sugar ABC transporter substrate-binding protein [Streptosporangium sp. NBC_01810]|uniref:sugar ABC transporter substrate-binding protein n=1 Tax=Streptosporangium sp. NBC_01810 TaxID=2975951 RepID=UPI002DDA06BE|nr:sugar ABC transporter substrate-binding protein [Streptosporangium sp. NBC_01810]WSA24150.1 sugar ABC transporter substrate-binding protein [Streptosporangium sp. NBC_01810]